MRRSTQIQRLLSFALKPLLCAVFVTLILHWSNVFGTSSKSHKKPINPHPHLTQSLVIASTKSSNLTWLSSALSHSHWKPHVYVTDDPSAELKVPVNKGNEAMVYLTYIIDNYDHLPNVIFFHHHHDQAWHQMFSSAYELKQVNLDTVMKSGYVSPRCLPGCENVMEMTGDVVPLHDLKGARREVAVSSILREFLKEDGKGVPGKIAAPCCAQFLVSREAVRLRTKEFWIRLREWLVDTEMDSTAAGRVLEYTWHMFFGKPPVFCPEEGQCLCDVYGVGDCSA